MCSWLVLWVGNGLKLMVGVYQRLIVGIGLIAGNGTWLVVRLGLRLIVGVQL